jgi:hypothetical protein
VPATNFIVGRCTASAIASASQAGEMHDIPMTTKSELDVQANLQASRIILARSARIAGRDLLASTALPDTTERSLARPAERTLDAFVFRERPANVSWPVQ